MHHRLLPVYSITKLSKLQYSLTTRHLKIDYYVSCRCQCVTLSQLACNGRGKQYVCLRWLLRKIWQLTLPASRPKQVTHDWDGHNMWCTTVLRFAYITVANAKSSFEVRLPRCVNSTTNLIMYYTYSHNTTIFSMSNIQFRWTQLHVSALCIGHHQVVLRLYEQQYNKWGVVGRDLVPPPPRIPRLL